MADRYNLDRIKKATGSQPAIHDSATVDALMGMVLALLGEVMVLRDRLDAGERLSEARGGHGPADIDAYLPDPDVSAARESGRVASYERVLGVARDRLMPETLYEQKAYERVLEDVEAR